MKILAIIGSPRKEGNTYLTTKRIEEKMKQLDPTVEFEYLFLHDANIKMCIGCRNCFDKGEASCPFKDDIPTIADKMLKADGVIFASPTYVGNMTGFMKNLLDRLAYFCHRPAFHDKKALLVSTTGGGGAFTTLIMMSIPLGAMGFHVTGKIGTVMNSREILPVPERYVSKVDNAATSFFTNIKDKKPCPPSIFSLVSFYCNRKYHTPNPDWSIDAKYWKEKGWLEPKKEYFTETKVNVFRKLVARIIAKFITST